MPPLPLPTRYDYVTPHRIDLLAEYLLQQDQPGDTLATVPNTVAGSYRVVAEHALIALTDSGDLAPDLSDQDIDGYARYYAHVLDQVTNSPPDALPPDQRRAILCSFVHRLAAAYVTTADRLRELESTTTYPA